LDQTLLVYAASVALVAGASVLVLVTLGPILAGRRAAHGAGLAGTGGRASAARTGWAPAGMPARPRIIVTTTPLPPTQAPVALASVQFERKGDAMKIGGAREASAGSEPTVATTFVTRRGADGPQAGERQVDRVDPARDAALSTEPGDWATDALTGTATLAVWNENIMREDHRFTRYRRPVTVALAELDGIESVAALMGAAAADRMIGPVGATLRRSARTSDLVARVGNARFAILLPETDEVAATNYAERVRAACDLWLAAGRSSVRLAVGWAMPAAGSHLSDALRVAAERMNADRRRADFRAPVAFPEPLTRTDES
jgi:diguanylate cyclase (GGDEF)-like protein